MLLTEVRRKKQVMSLWSKMPLLSPWKMNSQCTFWMLKNDSLNSRRNKQVMELKILCWPISYSWLLLNKKPNGINNPSVEDLLRKLKFLWEMMAYYGIPDINEIIRNFCDNAEGRTVNGNKVRQLFSVRAEVRNLSHHYFYCPYPLMRSWWKQPQ